MVALSFSSLVGQLRMLGGLAGLLTRPSMSSGCLGCGVWWWTVLVGWGVPGQPRPAEEGRSCWLL